MRSRRLSVIRPIPASPASILAGRGPILWSAQEHSPPRRSIPVAGRGRSGDRENEARRANRGKIVGKSLSAGAGTASTTRIAVPRENILQLLPDAVVPKPADLQRYWLSVWAQPHLATVA